MAAPNAAFPPASEVAPRLEISTHSLPERDRVPFFREEFARLLNCDVTALGEGPVQHSMSYVVAGPVAFTEVEGSPTRLVRTRRHLLDSDEDFAFCFFDSGWEESVHNRKTVTVRTGDALMYSHAMSSVNTVPEGCRVTALKIDARHLGALVRHPEQYAGEVCPASRPGVALLRGYMTAFSAANRMLTPQLSQTFGLHVVDLAANILTVGDGGVGREAGGVKAARLRAVLAAISARACDPALTAEAIAADVAVSIRYLHRTLEQTGETFSEHVTAHRLRQAWKLLSEPATRSVKISTVAYECGFTDLSHFNRAFRRRFGETPTAVREAAAPPPGVPPVSPLAASLVTH